MDPDDPTDFIPIDTPICKEIIVPILNVNFESLDEKLKQDPNFNRLIFPNDKTYTFDYTHLEIIKTIGYSRSVVRKCVHRASQRILAVKSIFMPLGMYLDDKDQDRATQLLREIIIHSRLRSDYVVRFYGFCIYEGAVHICMEFMNMSLSKLYPQIHVKYEHFPEHLLGYIAFSVVTAICDLLEYSVVHRDIKPPNILINDNGEIKLCDFGESRVLIKSYATTNVGTHAYLPPERFTINGNSKYDERSDVWSFGITLTELILGHLPYEDKSSVKSVKAYMKRALSYFGNYLLFLHFQIQKVTAEEILKKCFDKKRLKFYDISVLRFLKLCLNRLERRPRFSFLQDEKFFRKYSIVNKDEVKRILENNSYRKESTTKSIVRVTIERFAWLAVKIDKINHRQRSLSDGHCKLENGINI